jgi:dTDP-4-amino-4,6-dideoxygalactose transaminase
MGKLIKFNKPYVPESSIKYSLEALNSHHHQGDGSFTELSANHIEKLTGGQALLTTSCTHALEMASMLANIEPGDEVILPSFTFTSAATAVVHFGGVPVFVDIDFKSGCIDTSKISEAITTRTKAISWVNYAGNTPDLDALVEIATRNNLFLIEDNAHALGGSQKNIKLGSVGHVSTLSFHATKNFQCGEGGALVINSPELFMAASIIREKGTDRRSYLLGAVSKYQWVSKGSSYLMAESLAAILLGQLESYDSIQSKRISTWNYYYSALKDLASAHSIEILEPNSSNIAHMFALIFPNSLMRDSAISHLEELGVYAYSHYQPLHSSKGGVRYGRAAGTMENTVQLSSRILRLPLWSSEMKTESEKVVEEISRFLGNYSQRH